MQNNLKEMLIKENKLVGTWTMIPHPVPSEALSFAGYDFLVIDMEHALFSEADSIACIRALSSSTTVPIVRLQSHDPVLVKRMLDAGALNLMFPMVENAQQARDIVQSTRYPPEGIRGFAFMHRSSCYGTLKDYIETINQSICVILQVENATSVKHIKEFKDVSGIDAVFVGPGDLSASLNCHGQISNPAVINIMEEAISLCKEIKLPIGTVAPTSEIAIQRLKMGFNFVSVSNDLQLIMRGATEMKNEIAANLGN